jgi:hypothetical protein
LSYVKESAKGVSVAVIWTIVILAVIALIGGIVWGFGVATSGIKGQGDAVKINNSAENWTGKQEKFEKLNAGVEAAKEKVTLHKELAAENPNDLTQKQTLAGVRSACISAVHQYNAESRKVLSRDWKSPDLPYEASTAGCN